MSCISDQREIRRASWPRHLVVITQPPIAVDGCWLTYLTKSSNPLTLLTSLMVPLPPSETQGQICPDAWDSPWNSRDQG